MHHWNHYNMFLNWLVPYVVSRNYFENEMYLLVWLSEASLTVAVPEPDAFGDALV